MSNCSPKIRHCRFSDNEGGRGAAAAIAGAYPIMVNCTFNRNRSLNAGGALDMTTDGSGTFVNCEFYDNVAETGGAFGTDDSFPQFINCTFAANFARDTGGCTYINTDYPLMDNCIVWGNKARRGYGGRDQSLVGSEPRP